MKICIISSAAIPAPVQNEYGGLEAIVGWLTLEFAKNGNDVTLFTTKGSIWEGEHPIMRGEERIATMRVIGTVNPNWSGDSEYNHYLAYKDILEKEFVEDSVVLDHTWACYSYLSKQKFPKMNLMHVHHGMLGFHTPPPVKFPRFLGLSTYHAQFMSQILNVPVRHIHNGIPLAQFPTEYDPNTNKGDYLLSLNRITDEKGIHDSIDVAVSTNTPIYVVGDDTHVNSQEYVHNIIERCRNSNGLAKYFGYVDTNTKNKLLLGCKAVISCPKQTWMEAFGLYAVEANAYYKPVLALANGGLNDIVQQGVNGFLAPNTERLKTFVPLLDNIDPKNCRAVVEQNFTKEIMASRYLHYFQKILEQDPSYMW